MPAKVSTSTLIAASIAAGGVAWLLFPFIFEQPRPGKSLDGLPARVATKELGARGQVAIGAEPVSGDDHTNNEPIRSEVDGLVAGLPPLFTRAGNVRTNVFEAFGIPSTALARRLQRMRTEAVAALQPEGGSLTCVVSGLPVKIHGLTLETRDALVAAVTRDFRELTDEARRLLTAAARKWIEENFAGELYVFAEIRPSSMDRGADYPYSVGLRRTIEPSEHSPDWIVQVPTTREGPAGMMLWVEVQPSPK